MALILLPFTKRELLQISPTQLTQDMIFSVGESVSASQVVISQTGDDKFCITFT